MKTQLLFLFVLFLLFCLPNAAKAEQMQDSLNPCWELIYPDEPDKGYHNPDSVMWDTCLCDKKLRPKSLCNYIYAKQWFGLGLPYRALYIPEAPYDTLIYRTWMDIDTNYKKMKQDFQNMEKLFGFYRFRKVFPEDTDSTSDGSRYFKIIFDKYVHIKTIVDYLYTIDSVEHPVYVLLYGNDHDDYVSDNNINNYLINIYPNPTKNILNVIVNKDFKIFNLKIYNIYGTCLIDTYRGNYNKGEKVTIDINNWINGIYFIRINNIYYNSFFVQ